MPTMNVEATAGELLVVEDDADQWTLLQQYLARALPRVSVQHASDRVQTISHLQLARQQQRALPKLILQDFYLPQRADGLALLQQLKAVDSPYRSIPLVIMSSSDAGVDINEAYRSCANSYFIKPATAQEWIDCLQRLPIVW